MGSINKLLSCIVFLSLMVISCREGKKIYSRLEGNAQGTTFHIQFENPSNQDFTTAIDSLFRVIDKSMSLWDSTSLISRINRNEPNIRVDEHFEKVLTKSLEVSGSTNGAFDITVGPLVKAWGFSIKKGLPVPDSVQVDSLRSLIGYHKIKLVNSEVQKTDPRLELDFNAIAQGYTVDLISNFLEQKGIEHYMVEIGGEVRAKGVNDRDSVWVIGIDKPLQDISAGRPLQTSVVLKDQSLATSGSYRKFIEKGSKKYGHVIDPATGFPVSHNLISISVIADDCMTADAYATAFLVMGIEKSMEKARELKLEIYCIYTTESGELGVTATPGFEL